MRNFFSYFRKLAHWWISIFLFIVSVGAGTLGSSGEVVAGGGTFDVPEVNDHFEQVKPGPEPQKPASVTQLDKEESGIFDWLTEPVSKAYDWTADKVSAAWEKTKETSAGAWDGLVQFFDRMARFVVDSLSSAWDWILEHETLCTVVLTILGIGLVIVAVVYGTAIAFVFGVGILIGEILGGIVSLFSGNGFLNEGMLEDMLIWGISSGIAAIVFEWAAASVAGASLIASIAQKMPWLGKALPKMAGGAAAGGTDQSIVDVLKGKFNWKNTIIAAGLGFILVFGGETLGSHSDQIIKWMNNLNISPVTQIFADGTDSAPKTIGETEFGQWLQKFAAEGGESGTTAGGSTVQITVQFEKGFDDHLIKGNGIGKGRTGVIGAHNMDEFTRTLTETGVGIDNLIINKTPNSKFPGLYIIEYRVPSLTYDKSGNLVPSGQFKKVDYPKTVYDPKVYSDQQMIQWGKEAMQEGIKANRVKGRAITGYSSNRMKFIGYFDHNGHIKNFYPVIEEK